MKSRALPRIPSGYLLFFLLLFSVAANAARLEVDRQSIAVGEITTVHLRGTPFIAVVSWKVGPELEILDSDKNHARVRALREGVAEVVCEMNLSVHSFNITVRGAAPTTPAPVVAPVVTAPATPPPAVYVAPKQPEVFAAAPQGRLAGTWRIKAAGQPGQLELTHTAGLLTGRVRFDAQGAWEPLRELYFDEAIGELSFTRPDATQAYRGRLRGNVLEGRFIQGSGGGYPSGAPSHDWHAARSDAAADPATSAPGMAEPAGRLSLGRDRYAPGEAIVVDFVAPAGYASNAWIGIIPSHVPHGREAENDRHDLAYQYLQKRTSGRMTFTAPSAPGHYDLRLHDSDNNGREVASVSFQVGIAPADDAGRDYTARAPGATQGSAPTPPAGDDSLKDVMNQLKGLFGR